MQKSAKNSSESSPSTRPQNDDSGGGAVAGQVLAERHGGGGGVEVEMNTEAYHMISQQGDARVVNVQGAYCTF